MARTEPKSFVAELYEVGSNYKIMVVQVDAPTREDAEREIAHYVMMYGQDGPVEVKRRYPDAK